MAAYAWTPRALTWLHVNHLINGLHKQISWKNCLYADNLYFTLAKVIISILIGYLLMHSSVLSCCTISFNFTLNVRTCDLM